MDALEQTVKKFTNLMDGKVISNVSVRTIIEYYQSLVDSKPAVHKSIGNIEQQFQEQEIDELTEADFWDGDDSQCW